MKYIIQNDGHLYGTKAGKEIQSEMVWGAAGGALFTI